MNKRITLKDVAKAAGVSVPVVSVAINGTTGGTTSVSDELRDRILEIAEELDYRPNLTAKSLRGNKSFLIGVLLCSDTALPLYQGIQKSLKAKNYAPLFLCHSSSEEEKENIRFCLDRNVDAIIISSCGNSGVEFNLPVVEVFSSEYQKVSSVKFDYADAFEKLTRHLLNLGHKNIACCTENDDAKSGYKKSISSFGEKEFMISTEDVPDGITAVVSTEQFEPPAGISYAVVSYKPESELTHVAFDTLALADEVVKLALELVDKEPNHSLKIKGEITVLGSTSVPE